MWYDVIQIERQAKLRRLLLSTVSILLTVLCLHILVELYTRQWAGYVIYWLDNFKTYYLLASLILLPFWYVYDNGRFSIRTIISAYKTNLQKHQIQ